MVKTSGVFKKVLVYVFLIVAVVISLFPFYYMFVSSTNSNAEILRAPPSLTPGTHLMENLTVLNEKIGIARVTFNSLFVALVFTGLTILLHSMAGYALTKYNFRGKGIAFGVFLMRQNFVNFPTSLIEQGRIDGAGEFGIFFRIVMPNMKPALGALGIYMFMSCWNSFMWPLIILGYPWDSAPVGFWYRTDVFEEAEIDPATIETWDDVITIGQEVESKTGYKMLPMASSRNDIIYRVILMQQNSWYFTDDGATQVDSPESVAAMEMVKKLYDTGVTQDHVDWDDYVSTIIDNKVACFAEGVWMGGTIKDSAPEQAGLWRVMDLPMLNDTSNGAACNGGSLLAVPSSTESPEAAAEFCKFAMTDPDSQVHGWTDFGLYPSFIPVYDNEAFNKGDEFYGGENINTIFAEIGQKIPFVNFTPNFAEATDANKNAVAQVTLEGGDPATVMAAEQEELVAKFGQ